MDGHYIHVDLRSPLDADEFEDLTEGHHQDLLPGRQTYSVAGAAPGYAPHRFLSREGFLETIREAAGTDPPMTAVACIDDRIIPDGGIAMECFLTIDTGGPLS